MQTNLDFIMNELYNYYNKTKCATILSIFFRRYIMKKFLSILLVAAMTLSLGVLSATADTAVPMGIKATKYENTTYVRTIGEDSYGASCSFDNNEKFDASIDGILKGSNKGETEKVTSVTAGNADWYIFKWTGTMTAKESGTYTLIGRKIDNGFTMFVDGVKVYEYWGAQHWFDGGNDRLVSNDATFTVEAGKPVNVEIYFMELGGGDALEIFATTTPNDANSGANINDVFTFDLEKTTYTQKPGFQDSLPNGVGTDGNNGAQCVPENFKFDETIKGIMNTVSKVESKVVTSFRDDGKFGGDNYVVKYTGYMVPKTSGTYTFGATKMDNGFVLKMDGTKVYEMWANNIWNDNGSKNEYPTSIELEAGKAYKMEAYYLELGGGEALEVTCKVGDTTTTIEEAFTFYTANPTNPPKTGDAMAYALVATLATLSLGAVVVCKKRRIAE